MLLSAIKSVVSAIIPQIAQKSLSGLGPSHHNFSMWSGDIHYSKNVKNAKIHFKHNFSEFLKISVKLYNLLYWMSPDHILKLVGWPQASIRKSTIAY